MQTDAAQRLLSSIVALVPSVIYLFDLDRQTNVYVGGQSAEFLGYGPDEILALGAGFFPMVIHPDDAAQVQAHWGRLARLEDDQTLEIECRMRHRSGEWRWFLSRDRVFERAADGAPRQVLGVAQDITRRKEAEEALRLSEERFRVALLGTPVVVFNQDRDLRYTWIHNPALGFRPDEVVGRCDSDLFERAEEAQLLIGLKRQVIATRVGLRREVPVSAGDHTRYFDLTIEPTYGADGLVDGVTCVSVDVTERRRAEERQAFLSEASKLLAGSFDYESTLGALARLTVPALADWCMVDLRDPDGQIRLVGAAHADPAQAEGVRSLRQRYPPDPQAARGVAAVIRSGRPAFAPAATDEWLADVARDEAELRLLRGLGYRAALMVPLISRGQAIGAISLMMGHSGRGYGPEDLALAEELARRAAVVIENANLYREAQEAVRTRDAFLSVAAHELKNLLTALFGQAQLLKRRILSAEGSSERDRRAITVIADQAQQITAAVNTMLDGSRIGQGQLALNTAPLDLGQLVRQVIAATQPSLSQHRITLDCPEAPLPIQGDAVRLEQVLHNLLSNAAKYSPRGGPIRVQVARAGPAAQISVIDQGLGIPAAALPQLFHRFYRVERSETRGIDGMGVGLYVVKEIVVGHGGSVSVESVEGQGSAFKVELPIRDGDRG